MIRPNCLQTCTFENSTSRKNCEMCNTAAPPPKPPKPSYKVLNTKSHLAGKYVALYFSAHWSVGIHTMRSDSLHCCRCGPCRETTPQLAKFYQNHAKSNELEIVFVSSDHNEDGFDKYFAEVLARSSTLYCC